MYYLRKINLIKLEQIYRTESRIGRKIHDELANDVYSVMLSIQANNLKTPPYESEDILSSLNDIYSKTRKISHGLSIAPIESGLKNALAQIKNSYETDDLRIELYVDGLNSTERLEKNIEITVYRVLQELITNIKKHASASTVLIELFKRKNELTLLVEDNGIGFDTQKLHSTKSRGVGIKNTTSRIDSIGGKIKFNSEKSEGTTVLINIPL